MKTVEETLAELCDREAIRDLPLRYCDCVWRGDVAGVVDLFIDDGTFTIKEPHREVTARGREEMLKAYGEGFGQVSPRPYVHNHVVDLGYYGRATGRCSVELRSISRNMEWIGTGYYHDEYVKVGDQWKFASRHFTTLRYESAAPRATARRVAAPKKSAAAKLKVAKPKGRGKAKPAPKPKMKPRPKAKPAPKAKTARKKSAAAKRRPKR